MPDIDLRQYLNVQSQETCRAFVIHAPAMAGKTALARRMERILGAYRFDLQHHFIANEKLAASIDRFRPRDLEKLLLSVSVPQSVIVVDNLDFLLIVWTPRMKREFMDMVDLRLKSPDITSKTYVFMVQDDAVITDYRFTLTPRQPRILPLRAIKALV
jgi:hypothetical protein